MEPIIIEGTVTEVLPLQSGTSRNGNEWKKQEYTISTLEQYPRTVLVSFLNDKIDTCRMGTGQHVKVSVNIESRNVSTKAGGTMWVTNINGWKVEIVTQMQTAQPVQGQINYDQQAQQFFDNQPAPQPRTQQQFQPAQFPTQAQQPYPGAGGGGNFPYPQQPMQGQGFVPNGSEPPF